MKTRKLGEIEVSEIGMGCMAFSHGYGQIPAEDYSIEAIRNAQKHGCTLFDTAEVYSPGLSGIGHNERIVGKALRGVRDDVAIATKLFLGYGFGSVYGKVREHLEDSLERLQTDWVDIYYLHRTGGASVEKVAEAMGRLIDDGLIRGWGLSQVDVDAGCCPARSPRRRNLRATTTCATGCRSSRNRTLRAISPSSIC